MRISAALSILREDRQSDEPSPRRNSSGLFANTAVGFHQLSPTSCPLQRSSQRPDSPHTSPTSRSSIFTNFNLILMDCAILLLLLLSFSYLKVSLKKTWKGFFSEKQHCHL